MSSANLDRVRAFFTGNPRDLVTAIENPEWVELARQGLEELLTR